MTPIISTRRRVGASTTSDTGEVPSEARPRGGDGDPGPSRRPHSVPRGKGRTARAAATRIVTLATVTLLSLGSAAVFAGTAQASVEPATAASGATPRVVPTLISTDTGNGQGSTEPGASLFVPYPGATPLEQRIQGLWVGTYTCQQGLTAMELNVDPLGTTPSGGNPVDAVFSFHSDRSNPGVPSGSFRMEGDVEETPNGPKVDLEPTYWITQPPGYDAVGLSGALPQLVERPQFTGTIDRAGCGAFELHR